MRTLAFIVLASALVASPSLAAPQQTDAVRDAQPRGERWNDRWQGRHHWLYDDATPAAATDGYDANARGECRHITMRVKRSDGTTAIHRAYRCD